MKKCIKTILTGVILFGVLSACSTAEKGQDVDYAKLEFVQLNANRIVYNTLPEVEEASDMIIIGEIIDDPVTEIETQYSEYFQKDVYAHAISYSTIKVTRVLSGDVRVGDEVKIGQYCGPFEDQFISLSEMTPMLKGDTWIFCLKSSVLDGDDSYWCTGDSDGRYPLKNTTYRTSGLPAVEDLGVYRRDSFKDKIYDELLEKYDL